MDKSEALKILFQCADQYQKNLENKNLLLICANSSMNKVIAVETQFEPNNFMHLTGVKFQEGKRLAPDTFYTRCLARRLSLDDFELALDGTTEIVRAFANCFIFELV